MLEFLKSFFGEKSLSFDELMEAVKGSDVKPVNLADGEYVSKSKYDAEIREKEKSIEELKKTAEQRKTDLSDLKSLLEKAGTNEDGLKTTLGKISELQQQAEKDKADFDKKIENARREAAVKVFASGFEFTSKTARKGFIDSYLATNPELNDDGEVKNGAEFLEKFTKDDPTAVKTAEEETEDETIPKFVDRKKPKPKPEPFNLTKAMLQANGKE